jgi:hypothetical protein
MLEQFFTKEENPVLFGLYKIICQNSDHHLTYNDICKKYNESLTSSRKRNQQQI